MRFGQEVRINTNHCTRTDWSASNIHGKTGVVEGKMTPMLRIKMDEGGEPLWINEAHVEEK
jgi:ribosomal protein L21E